MEIEDIQPEEINEETSILEQPTEPTVEPETAPKRKIQGKTLEELKTDLTTKVSEITDILNSLTAEEDAKIASLEETLAQKDEEVVQTKETHTKTTQEMSKKHKEEMGKKTKDMETKHKTALKEKEAEIKALQKQLKDKEKENKSLLDQVKEALDEE